MASIFARVVLCTLDTYPDSTQTGLPCCVPSGHGCVLNWVTYRGQEEERGVTALHGGRRPDRLPTLTAVSYHTRPLLPLANLFSIHGGTHMIVYVGQCGEVYQGPTFPGKHGKECDLPRDHSGRHHAPVGPRHYDAIEFYDARQKAHSHARVARPYSPF